MIRQVLSSHYDMPLLSCVGLLLFLGVFIGAVLWVCRRGSHDYYAMLGSMPLVEAELGSVTRVNDGEKKV